MAINAVIVLGAQSIDRLLPVRSALVMPDFLGIGAYAGGVTNPFWLASGSGDGGRCASDGFAGGTGCPANFQAERSLSGDGDLGSGRHYSEHCNCNEAAWTGGPDGMPVPAMGAFGFDLSSIKQWYWVVALLLSVSVWASLNLIDSPFGRALRALHGSEGLRKWWVSISSATRWQSLCCLPFSRA